MKRNLFCSITLALLMTYTSAAFAQQAREEGEEYTREFVWGINKNTNGGHIGGLNVKYARRTGKESFRTFGFEVVNVKHPKEASVPAFSGGRYILGKQNYLYSLRFSYGLEQLLFRKGPQQGVQISALASAGPTLGIIAPYYIEIGNGTFTTTVQYDPNATDPPHNSGTIFGTGRPLEGIGESSFTAGLHARVGFSFEFGTFKSSVSGLEVGVMLEAFPNEVVLLPMSENRAIFPSAYLTFFHGSRR